jgi:hypothetical protein
MRLVLKEGMSVRPNHWMLHEFITIKYIGNNFIFGVLDDGSENIVNLSNTFEEYVPPKEKVIKMKCCLNCTYGGSRPLSCYNPLTPTMSENKCNLWELRL